MTAGMTVSGHAALAMTGIFGPGGIIFFPGRQERTSTVVLAAVLLVVGVIRRRPLHGVLATLAWIAGFEAAWQFTIFHFAGRPMGWPIPGSIAVVAEVSLILGVEWRWLAVAAAVWVVWLPSGFHYNVPQDPHIDWWAEFLNETAKTAWGLAYLWPLWRRRPQPLWVALPRPIAWTVLTMAVGFLAVQLGS